MRLKKPLYKFQKKGKDFLINNNFALLADEMGLGKTVQSIAATIQLKNKNKIDDALIVCPASLKYSWANEIKKFTNEKYIVIDGNKQEREEQWNKDSFFYITNYANLLTDDFDKFINRDKKWGVVIADEVTYIKNNKAKRSKKLKIIPRKYRWGLSGTPLQNSPLDLYSIVEFLHPYYFDENFFHFRAKYCELRKITVKGNTFKVVDGYKNLNELKTRIEQIFTRRTKKDVRDDMPDKVYKDIPLNLTHTQYKLYDKIMKKIKQKIIKEESVLGEMTKLRMLCNGTKVYDNNLKSESSKLEAFEELLEEGLKNGVVYTNWKNTVKSVENLLKNKKMKVKTITGNTSNKEKQKIVDEFNKKEINFVVGTKAIAYGLNLQHGTSNMILFDQPWNYALMQQIIDRIHRIDSEENVTVYYLYNMNTLEEKVLEAIRDKKDMFDQVFNNSNKIAKQFLGGN